MNRAALPADCILRKPSRAKTLCILIAAFTAACGGGGSSSNINNPPPPPPQNITVSISPPGATVAPGGSVQFTATVTGTTNTAVSWSAGGIEGGNGTIGTISASGVYTAPNTVPNPSAVNITAVSVADGTKSASATANVLVHHINQDFQNPPIKLGTSGGNATDKTTTTDKSTGKTEVFCCSGTLGALVSRGGNFYLLSNNHVLDKSDQGSPGDPISQPGLADTNCGQKQNTIVGNLTQAAPLKTSNVDAAIAQIVTNDVDQSGAILDLMTAGEPAPPSATIAAPAIGQAVAKSGDATGVTCSSINAVALRVTVDYSPQCQGGTPFPVTFTNQIGIQGSSFSNSGDSGSLVVTSDKAQPVGLLYAGSSTGTVANPINDVLGALKDSGGNAPQMVGAGDHAVSCPASPQAELLASQRAISQTKLPSSALARSSAAKDHYASELMQDPAVTNVEVGQSEDAPNQPAVLVLVKSRPRIPIPAQLDGVRTRIIHTAEFSPQQSTTVQKFSTLPGLSDAEVLRAKAVKDQHAETMMFDPAILGVGVGASQDSPGEPAIVVFVERGKQVNVPAEIEGVRTRIIETDRFRTFNWGKRTRNSCSRK